MSAIGSGVMLICGNQLDGYAGSPPATGVAPAMVPLFVGFGGSIIILCIARNIGNHNWGFEIPTAINRTRKPNSRRIFGLFAAIIIKLRPTQIDIAISFATLPFVH